MFIVNILIIHTYLLTPWCRSLLEQLTGLQLVKKSTVFHGTRRFITALTSVRHLSLSWARPIQSIYPHPTSCRSILILSTNSLAASLSDPALYKLLTFQVPIFIPVCLFVCCAMLPLETLPPPPGDPSGGVVYLRIVLSPEQASRMWVFLKKVIYREGLLAPRSSSKLEDHPSTVRDCLFNVFAATLHKGGRSSIRNLRTRHDVVTGTH